MKVRYYGHVGLLTGYGKAAEAMCAALLAAGVELEIRPLLPYENVRIDPSLPVARCLRRDFELDQSPDVVIVHTLPFDCAKVVDVAGLASLDVPIVAYTTWEGAGPIPQAMAEALSPFDLVWVPCRHNAESVSEVLFGTRVVTMPHAFDEDSLEQRRAMRDDAIDDVTFKFYYFGAWTCRKNPEGVLRAYTRAFTRADPVSLIVRSTGASEEDFAIAWHRTGFTRDTSPHVLFGNKPVTDAAILRLHQEADCYVTASRGEAWNLPCFDAMLAGRNVIAPYGHGSDDFLDNTSAARYMSFRQPAAVDVKVVPITTPDAPKNAMGLEIVSAHGQSTRTDWLEPDLGQLADHMRTAFLTRKRDIELFYDAAERFGYRAVGAYALTLLEAL